MNQYLSIIKESFGFFPLVAFLFTIPYILKNYRKYGSVFSIRVLIVYSFILYLLTAYFLVIMPLPDIEYVKMLNTPRMSLIPFSFVKDIIDEYQKSKAALYLNKALLQTLFNIIMTIPFGMYLHYYFEFDIRKTLKFSFLLSLFFELTQLSGLYFIYPRSYRLFDVDDLLTNTLGGVIGYYLFIPFSHLLPKRSEIDNMDYKNGKTVSFLRRILAFGIDIMLVIAADIILIVIFNRYLNPDFDFLSVSMMIYFLVLPLINNGKTFGCAYLKLQIVSDLKKNYYIHASLHYLLLSLLVFHLPVGIVKICRIISSSILNDNYKLVVYGLGAMLYGTIIFIEMIRMILNRRTLCDKLSFSKTVSTISNE